MKPCRSPLRLRQRSEKSTNSQRSGFFLPSLKFIFITICSNLLNYNLLFFSLQDNNNILFLAENLRIPRNLYEPIAEIADYKKYISALLMILFDRETLATHSLQGRRGAGDECHKPQLPPDILKGIIGKKKSTELFITLRRHRVENQTSVLFFSFLSFVADHVSTKFGVDCSQIRTAIRTKLNNEDKLLKKRLGLIRHEHRASLDPNLCQDSSLLADVVS